MEKRKYREELRRARLRITSARLATLEALEAHPHSDANTLVSTVRNALGNVSRQAIYDVLHILTEVGLVRRILTDGYGSRYELDQHDNHHHLVCQHCGYIEDIPCSLGYAPCIEPPATSGVKAQIAEVVYRGLCSRCAQSATTTPTPTPSL